MKKEVKWLVGTVATLALGGIIVGIVAYVNKDNTSPNHASSNPPKKLSFMLPLHQSHEPPAKLMQELEALTGYELTIQWVPDDIYSTKMLNVLDNKYTGQVMFVKSTDYTAIKTAIRSDLFWNIGSYLEHYPNLRALRGGKTQPFKIDGKVYGLANERPESSQGVIIRKDWLDRLGLSEPRNLDELYNVMKAFTEQDPDGNGKDDTYGIADRNDLYYGAFKTLSSYFGTPNGWQLTGNKFTPEFETPEYMATMDYMKKLYDQNIINKDFPVTSKSVQRYSLITGKAGVYIGSLADAPRLLEELRQVNPSAEFTMVNRIEGPKGYGIWSSYGNAGMFLFSKRTLKDEEQLKEAIAFFDRTQDADVANLLIYGIEDEHYILTDGMVSTPTREMITQAKAEVTPLNMLMIASISNPNLYKRNPSQTDPLLLIANEKIADNSSFLINNPTVGISSDTYDARNVELNSIISNATYNYILGKLDREGFINETLLWRERGGNEVIAEFEQAYLQSQ